MKRFFILSLFFLLITPSSALANSCKSLFAEKKASGSVEVLFPRRLHIREQSLDFLLKESSHRELAKALGTLFAKIQDRPQFMDQMAQALVEYSTPGSANKKIAPSELVNFFKENMNLSVKTADAELAAKIYEKLYSEMESHGLTLKEQYTLSLLLLDQKVNTAEASSIAIPKEIIPKNSREIFDLEQRNPEFFNLFMKRIKSLLSNAQNKKTLTVFNISFLTWFRLTYLGLDPKSNTAIEASHYINKLSKSKKTLPEMTINSLLSILNVLAEKSAAHTHFASIDLEIKAREIKKLDRETTLETIEDLILRKVIEDKKEVPFEVDTIIQLIDKILFASPTPKTGVELRSNIIQKAGNLLLPAKKEMSDLKAKDTLEQQQQASRTDFSFIIKSETATESQAEQSPSGRKRKHNKSISKKEKKSQEKEPSADIIEIDPKIDLSFWVKSSANIEPRPIKELNSSEVYQFVFARDTGRGLQRVQFEESVLEAFAEKPKTAVQLVKAIVYGPTSRNSSSAGIKSKAVKNEGSVNFYEARPAGTSANNEGAWRLLLKYDKDTQIWTVLELVPKNMMNKVLLSQ